MYGLLRGAGQLTGKIKFENIDGRLNILRSTQTQSNFNVKQVNGKFEVTNKQT